MRSIRRYLWLRLVLGLALLWILTGVALFATVRHSLLAKFDAELELLASEVRFLLPEGQFLSSSESRSQRTLDFFVSNSGTYFQAWEEDGLFSDSSPSLGDLDLDQPDTYSTRHTFWNGSLSTGEKVRYTAVHYNLPLEAIPGSGSVDTDVLGVDIVVARNREDLDRALSLVVIGTSAVGLLSALVGAGIVLIALKRGLAPLDRLGAQASAIDLNSLRSRFNVSSMPSELRPITDRLNDLMTRIEAGFERERRFSSDLAHELRTPVAELKTIGEFSQRWPDQVDAETFEQIVNTTTRMQALLESLLIMSRFELGAVQLNVQPLSLRALLQDAWRPLKAAAEARSLTMTFGNESDIEVLSDRTLLGVIVSNVLGNAVAYTPENGCIRAAVQRDGDRCVLRVENEVDGVTPEDVSHFFERLWRRDSSRTETDHHGLGLSLAQSCARILGFELSAGLNNQGTHLEMRICGPVCGPQTP